MKNSRKQVRRGGGGAERELRANKLKKEDYVSWFFHGGTIELNELTQTFN